MTDIVHEEHLLAAADHIARKSVRLMKQGDEEASIRAQNRLADAVAASRWPNVFLANLVESIGRENSLAVMIDREVVDFVLGRRHG